MKQLLEFVPLVLFFLAYKLQGIYVATGVLMAATMVQMAVIYAMDRKLALMHKVTLVLILLFGTMTLLLRDERFIKWKPTVLYIAMALTLAVALWGMKKNLLHILLGGQLRLPTGVLHKLTIAWVGYSLFMATLTTEQRTVFKQHAEEPGVSTMGDLVKSLESSGDPRARSLASRIRQAAGDGNA